MKGNRSDLFMMIMAVTALLGYLGVFPSLCGLIQLVVAILWVVLKVLNK